MSGPRIHNTMTHIITSSTNKNAVTHVNDRPIPKNSHTLI